MRRGAAVGRQRSAFARLEVRVQEDFRQEPKPDTTLGKLHDYVRDCDAAVAIMGDRSGSFPPAAATAPFREMLPKIFDRASMTQWEVHFARYYNKRMSIYVAGKDFSPAVAVAPNPDDGLQARLRDYLFEHEGLDRSEFMSKEDLARLVLKEPWPDHPSPPVKSPEFMPIGSLFKGREGDIDRLRRSLTLGKRAAVTAKAQALYGMGGVGKTRLAIEYGLAHQGEYSALLFVSGETPEILDANLQGLAGVLRIRGQESLAETERRQAVLDWLRDNPGWFLVIDNLDTSEALAKAESLLADMSNGHVVVTTRLSNFKTFFAPLDLDVLSVEASVEFLLEQTGGRRVNSPDDPEQARAIALDVGQLALALEQAAAYVAVRSKTFAGYRRDWAEQRGKVLTWWRGDLSPYPRPVADTFLLSFRRLTEAGRALLEHLAFLAPEPAPNALLEAPLPGINAADAREDVERYSLLSSQTETPTFRMHRLVQDVVRRGLSPEDADARCVATLHWLIAAIDPARHPSARERREAVLALEPHAEAAAGFATSSGAVEAARYLLVETGDALVEAGYLERDYRFQAKALAHARSLAARDPNDAGWRRDLSVSYDRVGDVQVAQGDLPAALASFRAGLAIREGLSKTDPGNAGWRRDLSVSHNKIGDVQVAQGDLPAALASFRAGLAIREGLSKTDPGNAGWRRDLSVSHNKIGDVQVAQGDLPAALASFRAGLAIAEGLSKTDPGNAGWRRDLSVSHNKIGDVQVAQGDLPAALASFRAGLAIAEGLSKTDPGNAGWRRDLSVSYDRVGDVQVAQGDLPAALASFRAGLAIREGLSKTDPGNAGWRRDLIVSCVKIAQVFPSEARVMLTRAGAIANRLRDEGRLAPVDGWIPEMIARRLAALGEG